MERRNLTIAIVLVAIIGVSSIGVFLYTPVSPKETYTHDTIGEPDYLDPAVDYETAGGEVIQQVYETLVFYVGSSTTELEGILASDWTVSPDGTIYTFTLRQGVKFTDGTAFNAYVMKWSLDRAILINDPDGPSWMLAMCVKGGTTYAYDSAWEEGNRTAIYYLAKQYLETGGIKVLSDYVLQIEVNYNDEPGLAYPPFIYILAGQWGAAVDPAAIMAHGGSTADSPTTTSLDEMSVPNFFDEAPSLLNGMGVVPGEHNEWMDRNAIGTGPYKVVEWTPATRLVMERNEYYWGGPNGEGLAKMKRVIINYISEFATRKLRLLAGDSDSMAWGAVYADQLINTTSRTVLPAYATDIEVILDNPTLSVDASAMNLNKTLRYGSVETVKCTVNKDPTLGSHENPFQYLEFRQAVQYVFDHSTYIKGLNGFGKEPTSPVIEGLVGYSPDVPKYPRNVTKAKELFLKVGWQGEVNIYYNSGNIAREKACLQLHDAIAALGVGIDFKVNALAWPSILAMQRAKAVPMIYIGWLGDYPDADNFIITYAHSSMGLYSKRIGYKNTTVDSILIDAATELNLTKRTAMYLEVDTELYRQAIYLWLAQPLSFRVQRAWVEGYIYNMLYSGNWFYHYYKL